MLIFTDSSTQKLLGDLGHLLEAGSALTLDSLSAIELSLALSDDYAIDLSPASMMQCETLADLRDMINHRIVGDSFDK
jgi:hypothetical protein